MTIVGMNHFTVLAKDLETTKAFYVELPGLAEGYRPDLGFPGAWLYAGDAPVCSTSNWAARTQRSINLSRPKPLGECISASK